MSYGSTRRRFELVQYHIHVSMTPQLCVKLNLCGLDNSSIEKLCIYISRVQMYGRYTELSKFAKQFASSQRERSSSGSRQSRTLGIEEAKRRKSKTWSE